MTIRKLAAASVLALSAVGLGACATMDPGAGRAPLTEAQFAAAPKLGDFMVFFNYGDTELIPEAQVVIQNAAQRYAANQASYLIVGHTDTSAEASDNLVLSQQRAEVVADELATAYGIPRYRMMVIGRGETDLLVNTADDTRELQNRRVAVTVVNMPDR